MDLLRMARHLFMTHWQVRHAFPPASLTAIEQAIDRSEAVQSGEVRLVVEGALPFSRLWQQQTASQRALDVFSQLRIWDTAHNNGVLIYLLLADRQVEIVADRGIHERIGSSEWESMCREMESAFATGDFASGAVGGITRVTQHLRQHFPLEGGRTRANELPNRPILL